MHGRKVWWLVALGVIGGAVTLSLSWGQDRSPAGADSSSAPMTLELTPARSTQEAFASRSGPDPSKYNALEKQMYLSASRGADWLRTVRDSPLWSGPTDPAVRFTSLPLGSFLQPRAGSDWGCKCKHERAASRR